MVCKVDNMRGRWDAWRHRDLTLAPYPTSALSGLRPSRPRCSAFVLFACVLSVIVILTEERSFQFQLRKHKSKRVEQSFGRSGIDFLVARIISLFAREFFEVCTI
jgi:hypothetical protein